MDYWNGTAALTKSGNPIDAILTPVAPFAALQLGKTTSVGYTPFVNVLDYSAVVFPVSKVDVDLDKAEKAYQPLNDTDKAIWEECKYTIR